MAVTATRTRVPKPRILSTKAIALDRLIPNDLNPRETYHFTEDNPGILALADSLRISGQQNPIQCYEVADKPGYFKLVKGHRRLFSARVANLKTLDAIIVDAPKTLGEELDLLGSEETLRHDWGLFSKMKYARQVALASGMNSLVNAQLVAKTGLTGRELSIADRMFRLEPTLVAHVRIWEEYTYRVAQAKEMGTHVSPGDFTVKSGIKVTEFSPVKAALVFDIFSALKSKCSSISEVKTWTDLKLQTRIAQIISRANVKEGERLASLIESVNRTTRPGALTMISSLLAEGSTANSIPVLLKATKNTHLMQMVQLVPKMVRMATQLNTLEKNIDQLGFDLQALQDCNAACLTLSRRVDRLQMLLQRKISDLQKRDV